MHIAATSASPAREALEKAHRVLRRAWTTYDGLCRARPDLYEQTRAETAAALVAVRVALAER